MRPYQSNNFNFIRFVLAMMVLLAHAPEMVDGNRKRELLSIIFRGGFSFGEVAVAGFFMLSGYLISKSWHDQPEPLKFLEKRIRRIFPAFLVASLVCALIVGPLGAQSFSQYFADMHPIQFVFGALMLLQPIIPPVFVGQHYAIVNGAMWTIPIEFSCYLGVMAVGMTVGFRRFFILVLTALLLGICVVEYGVMHLSWFDDLHPNLAAYFAVGSCFYVFKDKVRFTRWFALIAGLILFAGLFSYRAHQLVFSLTGSYLLFYFAYAKVPALANFGKLPDVSYGLYLYGWPIQKLILWWFPGTSPWTLFFASAIVAIGAGWASWHVIEKKFIKSKPKGGVPSSPPMVSDEAVRSAAARD